MDERSIQLFAGHASPVTTRHYDRRSNVIELTEDVIQNVLGSGEPGEPQRSLKSVIKNAQETLENEKRLSDDEKESSDSEKIISKSRVKALECR